MRIRATTSACWDRIVLIWSKIKRPTRSWKGCFVLGPERDRRQGFGNPPSSSPSNSSPSLERRVSVDIGALRALKPIAHGAGPVRGTHLAHVKKPTDISCAALRGAVRRGISRDGQGNQGKCDDSGLATFARQASRVEGEGAGLRPKSLYWTEAWWLGQPCQSSKLSKHKRAG